METTMNALGMLSPDHLTFRLSPKQLISTTRFSIHFLPSFNTVLKDTEIASTARYVLYCASKDAKKCLVWNNWATKCCTIFSSHAQSSPRLNYFYVFADLMGPGGVIYFFETMIFRIL